VKAWQDLRKLSKNLWILCFATLINRLGTMALPFLVLYLTKSLNYSASQAGSVLALYGGIALLIGPVAGRLSDRWGAVWMMETSLIASGLVLLIFPLAHSMSAVMTMTALLALTNESFRPANLALVSELAPPELRKSAFALSRWSVNLGMSVGPALGGFLAQASFPMLFVVDGFSTLAAAGILVFTSFHSSVREFESPKPSQHRRAWLLQAFFSDADLRIFLLALLPVSLVFFQNQSAMPLYLVRQLHFSEAAYGLLFSINTLLIITLEIPLNSATAHWSHRRTLAIGALLFGIGFGALAIVQTYAQVVATVIVWTFGEMILFPGSSAYISEIAPEGRRGEYMGLYMMAFSFAFMIGPWVGTWALEHLGPTLLWILVLVMGVLSTLLFTLIRRRQNPVTAPKP
jgi:MFS family permease